LAVPEIMVPATARVLHRAVAPLDATVQESNRGDDTLTLTGYAAVTNTVTTLVDSRSWVWREQIAPGAFRDVLQRIAAGGTDYPVVLNHEHDNRASIASTNRAQSELGGLELMEDARGLRVFARLDPTDPDVARLAPKMRNGVTTQMSFAFTVPADGRTTMVESDDAGRTIETDTIVRVGDLFDVTVCAHGAYPQTSAELRNLLVATGRSPDLVEGPSPQDRTTVGPDTGPVAPMVVGGGDTDRRKRLAVIRLELLRASATHKPKEGSQ